MLRDFKVIRFILSSVYNTGLYKEMGVKSCNDVCVRGVINVLSLYIRGWFILMCLNNYRPDYKKIFCNILLRRITTHILAVASEQNIKFEPSLSALSWNI